MRCILASSVLVVLIGIGFVVPAQAQINSPPPALMGQPSYHLYTVPGVTAHPTTMSFFRCTNVTSEAIRVGIEVFDLGGTLSNDASATSLEFFPGGTFGFSTGSPFAIHTNSSLGVTSVNIGSARILATQPKGIVCTAFLGDGENHPPSFMVQLNVLKKTTQKGD